MEGIVEIQQIITNASLVEKVAATPQTFAINANTISNENNNSAGIKKTESVNEADEVLEPIDDSDKKNSEDSEEDTEKDNGEGRAYDDEASELEGEAYDSEGAMTNTDKNQENLNKKDDNKRQHINIMA
ncbi:MAG: hypothetical protein EVJ46_08385 [Candidatus Acididesulfobacter guangdongensis]|uniref:Uncharacterized protein n=1 Tax=Acididesulfobacter guangdongensis TaxID=2597225 RepID=A0A519BG14_ACIG2|nr:MAG: hypothetical protein EVJ46_08385 [Candidatus Acididesulfobacter guangdongensis]